ncbi:conserved hypothetical protein [Leishmania major strain Friedlin]|uniref:Uncharacterized protein n=1 Tax=Leishmania major TaxID=5664 RepID=Q4Q583_LEIMA|nr:conserved hypothetical protein [Leishmania major strain Friedlin]CAG9580326.1 hypothetical_protein_-_conserved [Leishmania major strain Friedlin]CAJ08719.1 conserved hypothetical protein [Leishmania major strain Friedlin]|eukprot:XP_001685515.1 conserved hypothetical protein [Leishmania major strain Friedlin]
MQQHHPQGCIVPVESQADVSECAHLNKGEVKQELGYATRRHEPQSLYGEVNDVSSSECSEADAAGQPQPAYAGCGGDAEESHDLERKGGDAPYVDPDRLSMLWTMDEETVLMHSSQVSLQRIRTRLEMLLLGVSEAICLRKACDALQHRASSRPVMDYQEKVLAADHALRRIIGEAFVSFAERDAVQMVHLCSLADKGVTDCDELVRNAVVVLQALLHDGEAVQGLEPFRQFVSTHRAEIRSQQWQHDFITALRSLAVGFLRHPEAVMAAYGHSVNQIVQREAFYVALLRFCGGRPVGYTSAPANAADKAKLAVAKTQSPHAVATSRLRASRVSTPLQRKRETKSIHATKHEGGAARMQRPSVSHQGSVMPPDLPQCVSLCASSTPSRRRNFTSKCRPNSTTLSRSSVGADQKASTLAPRRNDR